MKHVGWAAIDADLVAYRAGFAAEPTFWEVYYDGHKLEEFRYKADAKAWVAIQPEDKQPRFKYVPAKEIQPVSYACQIAKTIMKNILHEVKPIAYKAYLTSNDKSCFRYEVAVTKPYKGGRGPKPVHLEDVRTYLVNRWGAEVIYGEEADDALAKFQYDKALRMEEGTYDVHDLSCIVSYDKDLKQIPGLHYDFVNKDFSWITKEEGIKRLYLQALTGDSVDSIPGLPGVGATKAEGLLAGLRTEEELHDAVVRAYTDKLGVEKGQTLFEEQFSLVKLRTN